MSNQTIAHAYQKDDAWTVHLLELHLQKVAGLAKRFAGSRGAVFAEYAGLLHDLGKFQQAFQDYIRTVTGYERENAYLEDVETAKPNQIPHSTAGAKYATTHLEVSLGHVLAYLIAGHHAGLADWHNQGSLKTRLQQADKELEDALKGVELSKIDKNLFAISDEKLLESFPIFLQNENNFKEIHIWIRFLFSCLVDADFLDTEAFMNGYANADDAKAGGLRPTFVGLDELHARYEIFMENLAKTADKNSALNQQRNAILQQCFDKALLNKSLFSLTVPTGGGKTLASLGFALKHALKFNKKRIIYAIPFTSIIEQNAQVFKKVLGDEVVLEHHSNLEVQEHKQTNKTRLASENWDAPLIVTTNVQLFESLFSAKTSRCRKIHNIADSVIILDEAQQIPREFQKPITDMMRILAKDYGVTFVLCTATQPELGKETDAFGRNVLEGLPDVFEIIANKNELAQTLRRVHITFPAKDSPKQSWQEVANEIAQKSCVLAVVNTRRHAQKLFDALPSDGIKLHLSANMCAMHRAEVIALIRLYLKKFHQGKLTKSFWVVSTQLIEAGVDLDFPCVYRAMAGLDSIAQSAGRCNREGKLPNLGEVVVFRAEQGAPTGSLKQGQDITEELLQADRLSDPLSPDTMADYFKRFNAKGSRDKHEICKHLTAETSTQNPLSINFRTASDKFRLIDNNGITLIVPFVPLVWQQDEKVSQEKVGKIVKTREFDEFFDLFLNNESMDAWQKILGKYRHTSPTDETFVCTDKPPLPEPFEKWLGLLESDPLKHKWVYRQLQRYTITVYEHELNKLPAGAVFERAGLLVLDRAYYDELLGAEFDDQLLSPEQSVL